MEKNRKKELRKQAFEQRNTIPMEQVIEKSLSIQRMLFMHPWYVSSNTIFTYVSMGHEVQTHQVIRTALGQGKTVCVPRVIPKEKMVAVPIRNLDDDLAQGHFNVLEPKEHLQPIDEQKIDLVIVPGLLFDRKGFRIGYGGGYYDRFLSIIRPDCRTIGLAFDMQLAEDLPIEAFDRNVGLVITEREMIGE